MLLNELHQGGIRALLDYDNSIFDNMQLPEGIDLADVVDHILYKYGDTPLFTPDPSVIKFYIGRWSKRRLPLWERYKNAVELEYNPIENYDRSEKSEFTHGEKIAYEGTITNTPSGSIKTEQDDTTTNGMAADNSTTFQNDTNSVLDGETVVTYQQYQEETELDHTDTHSGKDVNESRIHGNIGVTTSQQMLTSELDLIPRLDVIDYIATDFHNEFNLMMYY